MYNIKCIRERWQLMGKTIKMLYMENGKNGRLGNTMDAKERSERSR